MFKKCALAALVATTTVLTACGGGGGSGGDGSSTTPPPPTTVSGPLNPVQTSLSSELISPLSTATAGTPLEGVLNCTDAIVNQNILDIVDAFAIAVGHPNTLSTTAPALAQGALNDLVANLGTYLTALSGVGDCAGAAGSLPGTNPLAGTPLDALGAQLLPVLSQVQAMLPANDQQLSADQLNQIVAMLSSAFDSGIASLGTDPSTLPFFGDSLLGVQDALNQLSTLAAMGTVPSPNQNVIAAQIQSLVNSVLSNELTQLLPVADLQGAAGGGDLVATFQAAIDQLTAGLANPTSGGLPPLPIDPFGAAGFGSLDNLVDLLTGTGGLPTALDGATLLQLLTPGASNPLEGLFTLLTDPIVGGDPGSCTLPILGPILGLPGC